MVNLFNYIDRESPIHRLTGATKLLCLLLHPLQELPLLLRHLQELPLLSQPVLHRLPVLLCLRCWSRILQVSWLP